MKYERNISEGEIMVVCLCDLKKVATWEQINIKLSLVPLEVQFSLVYHTKNPRSVVVGDFFYIQQSEGWYDETLPKNVGIMWRRIMQNE